jgi:glycosyltransferase involved in cell wall biosynthesis
MTKLTVSINGKYLSQAITGVQRYSTEIVKEWYKMGRQFDLQDPQLSLVGRNNLFLWEQLLSTRNQRDILWCPTNTGPLLYRNKVLTLHDGAVLSNPEWFSAQYVAWRKIVVPRLLHSSRKIITVSAFSKRNICEYTDIDQSKVVSIHNGINHEQFYPRSKFQSVLDHFGIAKPYILVLGSVEPRKNIERVFQAWANLYRGLRDEYELVIVGSTGRSFKQQNISVPSTARMLGYVDDQFLPGLYSGASVFLYPSLFEGFGLTVLEAMACGAPVITSNVSALPEVGGNAVCYVDPLRVDDIVDRLSVLLVDSAKREKYSRLGLIQANKFTWSKTADKTWNVLNGVDSL